MYFMSSKVVAVSTSDSAALKEIFFSGAPWLVQCTKDKKASQVLRDAEGSLKTTNLGLIDCDAALPSGKTLFQRFKLSPPSSCPVYLAAANMEKPQIVPCNELRSGSHLAAWATKATAVKVYAPTTTSAFDSQCLKKQWCAILLSAASRLNDAEKVAITKLAAANRRVRVVKVDAANYNLLLDLPGAGVPTPVPGASELLLLKQLEGPEEGGAAGEEEPDGFSDPDTEDITGQPVAARLLSGGLRDAKAAAKALGDALASAAELPEGFSRLAKRPSLRPKRAPQRAYKSTSDGASKSREAEPAAKTLTDAELKALRAERERMAKEREQQQREAMAAEEAAASNIVEEVAEEPAGGGGAPLEVEGEADEEVEERPDEVEEDSFD